MDISVFRLSEIKKFGNLQVWEFRSFGAGRLEIQEFRNLEIQKFDNLEIERVKDLRNNFKSFGTFLPQISRISR